MDTATGEQGPAFPGGAACPRPIDRFERIQLGHGSGGRLTRELVEGLFLPILRNPALAQLGDSAIVSLPDGGGQLALTTDGYVVSPPEFPGGDIGLLAVHGTVNDLAVAGAEPLWLTAALILEEGLDLALLERIVRSMAAAAERCGVALVAGDTKVVDRGKGDQVFVATAGVGRHVMPWLGPQAVRPGDRILVSGGLGEHGMAVMSVREGLAFESPIRSDTASLLGLVRAVRPFAGAVRWMRDATRGGVATVVCELAAAAGVGIELDEAALPVSESVAGACELLGLDPLYVANEGKLVLVCAPDAAGAVLAAMRTVPEGRDAVECGVVRAGPPRRAWATQRWGTSRLLELLPGEQLPRIC